MSGPGGYGGIVFHNAPRGAALDGGTVKWAVEYDYAPETGVGAGGLSFIQNNANTRLCLASNGNVGIGTTDPQQRLHVIGNIVASGNVGVGTTDPQQRLHVLGNILATGNICANNGVNCASDRNIKAGFEPMDPKTILEKVAALPITRWHYTNDTATPHVGPMAQDFHAAFGLGTDDKHIATVDADGVALAAIQGLNQKLTDELKLKGTEIVELKQRLDALERIIHQKSN
jgi:hypothetical protein